MNDRTSHPLENLRDGEAEGSTEGLADKYDPEFSDLQDEYPGWNVRASGDAWKATRLGDPLTGAEHFAGLAETLIADSAEDLKELLVEQQLLAGGAA